jgi:hypothetical protein
VNTNSIKKQAFSISPNSVKGMLNIQGVQNNSNYQITNAIRQTCLGGKFTEKLDVSALIAGAYLFNTEIGSHHEKYYIPTHYIKTGVPAFTEHIKIQFFP